MHRGSNKESIPRNHQIMLWWAGLRGAIAFALSVEVKGSSSMPIRTTTLVVCLFTILALGGSTKFAIDYLAIPLLPKPTDPFAEKDADNSSDEADSPDLDDASRLSISVSSEIGDDDPLFSRKTLTSLRGERDITNWLVKVDQTYLRPFFCKKKIWKSSENSVSSFAQSEGI